MTLKYLQRPADGVIPLPAWSGHKKSAHVIDDEAVFAINAALATGRPLLVLGDPGMGKSQLARAAAVGLERELFTHSVDARTEPRDLLWTVDAVARLAEAQVMGALHGITQEAVRDAIDVRRFTRPGALWWAFDRGSAVAQCERAKIRPPEAPPWPHAHGSVVLIDEIDKADVSVPNALLDALGHGRFEVPGCEELVAMKRDARPLVLITTNEERTLPDAFLRRCFVLRLDLPDDNDTALREALVQRGIAHFGKGDATILGDAAEKIATRRAEMRNEELPAPGVAEYIDLVEAVLEQRGHTRMSPQDLMEAITSFVLYKHAAGPKR